MYNLPSDSVITLTELEGTLIVLYTACTVMPYLTNSSNPLIVVLVVDWSTVSLPSPAKLSIILYDMTYPVTSSTSATGGSHVTSILRGDNVTALTLVGGPSTGQYHMIT